MKNSYFTLSSDNIGKYTNTSSGWASFLTLLCFSLAGVCFFLFAGISDLKDFSFVYCGSILLGVICIAMAGYTFLHHLKKEAERNNGGYVIIRDFLKKKVLTEKENRDVACFYFQNYQTCFQQPILGSKKEFDQLQENKDCYLIFDNQGNCLSIFDCDTTQIDSSVAENMIYSYSVFLDLEDYS